MIITAEGLYDTSIVMSWHRTQSTTKAYLKAAVYSFQCHALSTDVRLWKISGCFTVDRYDTWHRNDWIMYIYSWVKRVYAPMFA